MNVKKIFSVYMVATLIFSMAMLSPNVSASPTTDLYVMPPEVIYISNTYCEKNNTVFTVKVNVTDVSELYGYDVYLEYNSTILEKVSTAFTGTGQVVPANPSQYNAFDSSVSGEVRVAVGFIEAQGAPSFNGTGVLVWIDFKIIYCPPQLTKTGPSIPDYNWANCTLHIDQTNTALTDKLAMGITIDNFYDGEFAHGTKSLIPGEPIASFTAPDKIAVCSTATCTDTSDPGSGAVIVTRDWQLINGTGTAVWTTPNNGTTRTFHCLSVGTVTVVLNVTNSFDNSDDASKEIDQYEVAGAFIDVFTSDNRFCGQTTTVIGKGLDEPCDALSPDVNVTIFANVTWNKAPINHALVAFEVIWEWYIDWQNYEMEIDPEQWVLMNETFLIRTAETNKDGIAQFWFRVPNPCEGQMFGKWLIIAKVKIQDETVMDTMRFHVGYLITLEDYAYTYGDAFYRCVDCITVYVPLKNIGYMTKHVTLVVTAYDDCDVPIGQLAIPVEIPGGVYCHPKEVLVVLTDAICVPQWAYVGYGKIYISALTDLPRDCGIPYCPEQTTNEFEILYAPCPP